MQEEIEQAVRILRAGGLVAFPTETVYGLGADASNPAAVQRIFEAKGRPAGHPLIVHLASEDQLAQWASEIPSMARQLARRFWPGPIDADLSTKRAGTPGHHGRTRHRGLRVPSRRLAQTLLRAFGGGLAAPSADRFGGVSRPLRRTCERIGESRRSHTGQRCLRSGHRFHHR